MANITIPTLRTVSLDPVRAEIFIDWALQPGDEVRGKFAGPTCRYASTIDIAYPITRGKDGFHVLIPEPSAWEPVSPFLYLGKMELIREGRKVDDARVQHGLLHLARVAGGWRLNGKPFEPRTVEVDLADEEELLRLREEGFNTLVPREIDSELWERAARIGFLLAPEMSLPAGLQGHFLTLLP